MKKIYFEFIFYDTSIVYNLVLSRIFSAVSSLFFSFNLIVSVYKRSFSKEIFLGKYLEYSLKLIYSLCDVFKNSCYDGFFLNNNICIIINIYYIIKFKLSINIFWDK